ncbi:hypothetical protein, partial [Lentzea sp.]|uniref:hypothetical protein n=1 Tax=Lentzea sp. TaxID=56099 RepID=UPI002ED08D16
MYPSEIVFQPALGRARGFSALVITADRLFGTRLTSNLVHSGAGRVDVVRTVSEIRPAAGLEERDLIVADLDLPDEAAHLLLDDVQRLQGHYLVAVLAPQS